MGKLRKWPEPPCSDRVRALIHDPSTPLSAGDDITTTHYHIYTYWTHCFRPGIAPKLTPVSVTGTLEGLPTSPTDIKEGKIDGDTVTFWVNTDYQGTAYKLVYKGKVQGDEIHFEFGTDDGSWGADLVVKRAS